MGVNGGGWRWCGQSLAALFAESLSSDNNRAALRAI